LRVIGAITTRLASETPFSVKGRKSSDVDRGKGQGTAAVGF
jgi:hypothetical protein